MRRFFVFTLLAFVSILPAVHAEGRSGKHLDDPKRILPANAVWRRGVEEKLEAFQRTTEIKILVQFHQKSPSPDDDKVPGAFMQALATRLGVETHGVLVVYFADDPDWRIWIGDELTSLFTGKPGTAGELTESGAIHETKEVLLTTAQARAEAAYVALQRVVPAEAQPAPTERVRLQTEALLDGLIEKFSRK